MQTKTKPPSPATPVLEAFGRAATRVPAYRSLLQDRGVEPDDIQSLTDFQEKVPTVNKQDLFGDHRLAELCVDGDLDGVRALYTSSGYSGIHSFGVETPEETAGLTRRVDGLLDLAFGIREHPALLINALPGGVEVPTQATTSIAVSTRPDAVLACICSAASSFSQLILIAEQPMVKEVLDLGLANGIDWTRHTIRVVTGAEVMPENFRRYVHDRLEHTPSPNIPDPILLSLGISEVSLSLGIETPVARRLRQAGHADPVIGQTLFGVAGFVPTIVQYDPCQFHIETPTLGGGPPSLVVTTLDPNRRLPLIRYHTNDWAEVLTHQQMNQRALDSGLDPVHTQAPFLLLFGRGRSLGSAEVYPEQIKERLYQDAEVAGQITGAFRLHEEPGLSLSLQLNDRATPGAPRSVADRLAELLKSLHPGPITCQAMGYHQYAEQYGMSFQRKFQYV